MQYKAYLFDLDGTLLDTLDDLTAGVNYAMRQSGWPEHSREAVRGFIGHGIRNLMERSVPAGTDAAKLEQTFRCFEQYYTAHCNVLTKPFPGISDVLSRLREEGCGLAVVSNKNDAAVKELARAYFPGVSAFGVSGTTRRKPAPDTVLAALRELGCEAKDALYIGDSDVDKETADNAGMNCALVTWGYRDRPMLAALQPKYLVDEVADLIRLTEAKEETT